MVKNIKKSLKYIVIVSGIIIAVPSVLFLLLQNYKVQTFMVNRITRHLSADIRSVITVGTVDYKFFNKLVISDLLVKDANNDTLLFSSKVTSGIKRINIKNRSFKLGKVTLADPLFAIRTDSAGQMNLRYYLDLLRAGNDTLDDRKKKTDVIISQIDLNNGKFLLINKKAPPVKTKIDFRDLEITKINTIIEDFLIHDDTVSFNLYNLGFLESNGFTVTGMNSSMQLARQHILFNTTKFRCDSSLINISRLSLNPEIRGGFRNFTDQVRLDISLERSQVYPSDLQYFIPAVEDYYGPAWLSGKVFGTVAELRGRDIKISYLDSTYIDCDFDFSGLPVIDNTFIYLGVNDLQTNAEDIEEIKIPGDKTIVLPDFLYQLGNISFKGSFTGFTTDFVTYGNLESGKGSMSTDISFRPERPNRYRIQGLINGSDVDIGKLTGNDELIGNISLQANVDGYAYSFNSFATNLTGNIDSIRINDYLYRNIDINGFFTEKTWDGSIEINDENVRMDLLGMFNFSKSLPEFDFTLNIAEADLHRLNFDKADTSSSLTLLITANFKGDNIDNLDGEIRLLNSRLRKFNKYFELYDFSVKTFAEDNLPSISLRTDFVDADLKGYYNFATISNLFNTTLSDLMPAKFEKPEQPDESTSNNFNFEIRFKNTDRINNFLRTGLLLADGSYFNGSVFADSLISLGGKADYLALRNNIFRDLTLDARAAGSDFSLGINSSSLFLLGQTELKDFIVDLTAEPDKFNFDFRWDNKDSSKNKGNFIARGGFLTSDSTSGNAELVINIDSSEVHSHNKQWKISQSQVRIDTGTVEIDYLYINNNENFYLVNGVLSENPSDTLNIEFNGIDIYPLNMFIGQNNTSDKKVPLNLQGTLDGKIALTNVFKNLLLESNININDFSLLESRYGTISVNSAFDLSRNVVNIYATNNMNDTSMFEIEGYYDPELKKIDLTGETWMLPVNALNPLLQSFASDITGMATGKINLSGTPGNLMLEGAVLAENANIKIDYLQTKYTLNDSIRFDRSGIRFNDIDIVDERGNAAILSGAVHHTGFRDFRADLLITTDETQVLNTKQLDNELFYGIAYASGVTTIKSDQQNISLDISAITDRNTRFYIPLGSGLSVSDYSFINFINVGQDNDNERDREIIPFIPHDNKKSIDINFDLEVTPDAEVQLIFDSKVGDVMKGHGSGNLNINLDKDGNFRMTGDYIIDDGDYLFTLGNILNKPFSVENGGRITFNGDLNNAEIDIKAIYSLRASLDQIIPIQEDMSSERVPVECQLNLTGNLFSPIVGFDIYLPTVDEQTRTYLRNAISTEEELSRQFLYLLVMNSFYADPSNSSLLTSTTTTGTSAMAVTTTEMLSNQLSNWLSQISNDFDIGIDYRPGSGNRELNSQEVEVALSTQILNDKVLINSNLDLRGTGNSENTNQITGDFDAEVKITEKIRFKVFNRFNNPYTGKGAPYTQGIGIFYKQDFNKFSDLFKRKVTTEMKKEEEVTITSENIN